MKKISSYFLLIVTWVSMWLFAFSYVSANINQHNQELDEKIQARDLNYQWSFESMEELVSSFRKHWKINAGGAFALTDKPEISLDLQGAIIDTEIHQGLRTQFDLEQQQQSQAKIKLEFSNQQQHIFYDSPLMPWSAFEQSLDLNAINWVINQPGEHSQHGKSVKWQNIGPLDALVIRFYHLGSASLTLHSIEIKQTQAAKWQSNHRILCHASDGMFCGFSNYMRQLNEQVSHAGFKQQVYFSSVFSSFTWYWFLLAWVACSAFCLINAGTNRILGIALTAVVFVIIGAMHQPWVATYFAYAQWPFMIILVLMLWQYRKYFNWPENPAKSVWLISLALALLLFSLGGFRLSFLQDLPHYLLWAWVQQLLLGPVVAQFIYRVFKPSKLLTACFVGVLFSIIHSPNHMLMLVTLVGGVSWAYAWLKFENLYANVVSHAVLALLFYQAMPIEWLGSARIGIFF